MFNNFIRVKDYEEHAEKFLPKAAFEFFAQGSGHNETVKNNVNSYKRYRIKPRYLRNVEKHSLKTKILGKEVDFPIGCSPTAIQQVAHEVGELGAAKAAQDLNTIYTLSSHASCTMEELAKAAPYGRKWLQCYVFKVRDITKELIAEAERLGFEALVLTVDFPVLGSRYASAKYGSPAPYYLREPLLHKYLKSGVLRNPTDIADPSADWSYIKWLKTITKLPIVAKGVLSAEDAVMAVENGVSAILVSNHGGRQLDGVPSTLEALPEVVKAVGDKVEVYVDGGIRDGTDVFKAIALGARMVFIGRPIIWGLFYDGERGVKNILTTLRDEFEKAVLISGCGTIDNIKRENVVHEAHYSKL